MSQNGMQVLAQEIAAVFVPLRHLDSPEAITSFFHDLGYELPGGQLFADLPALGQLVEALIAAIEGLASASTDQEKLEALAPLLEALVKMVAGIHDSLDTIKSAVSSVPGFTGIFFCSLMESSQNASKSLSLLSGGRFRKYLSKLFLVAIIDNC